LFEPFISLVSRPVYGMFHHEPIAWKQSINLAPKFPPPRGYYAAQGNATRLFFRREISSWPEGWKILRAQAFSSFAYLLSGGYSKRALYPAAALGCIQAFDKFLSHWPRVFGSRCLIALERL
jgi:hypothetical protein